MKGDDFSNRLLSFSVRILKLCEALPNNYTGKHISKQLIRSGTSIGANYEEARGAESKADFKHKMRLSLKEARETIYWLKIIQESKILKPERLDPITKEADEICSVLVSSIKTMEDEKQSGES